MKLTATFVLAFTISLGLLSTSPADAEETKTPPQHIVAAGGDMTEIIFALGLGDRLAGVDSTSVWPAEAKDLPQIGYFRRIAPEGVLTLTPDLVLAGAGAGPDSALEILASSGVAVAVAPRTGALADVPAKIRFVGEAVGASQEAEALAARVGAELVSATEAAARISDKPRVLFILSIRDGAPIVGGRGSSADLMIEAAGGDNVAGTVEGWKPMSREAIIAAAPEVIVMTTAHSDRLGGLEEVLSRPDIALTPAGRDGRGARIDAMLILGLGPRVAEGVKALARAIHPAEALAAAGL